MTQSWDWQWSSQLSSLHSARDVKARRALHATWQPPFGGRLAEAASESAAPSERLRQVSDPQIVRLAESASGDEPALESRIWKNTETLAERGRTT